MTVIERVQRPDLVSADEVRVSIGGHLLYIAIGRPAESLQAAIDFAERRDHLVMCVPVERGA